MTKRIQIWTKCKFWSFLSYQLQWPEVSVVEKITIESYNQSINGSSNDSDSIGVLLFVTCLSMVISLTSAIIVIPPAVTVINVIWQTRELHTNYILFFIAQLIATKATWIIVASVQAHHITILYLLGLNSDYVDIALKWTSSHTFYITLLDGHFAAYHCSHWAYDCYCLPISSQKHHHN